MSFSSFTSRRSTFEVNLTFFEFSGGLGAVLAGHGGRARSAWVCLRYQFMTFVFTVWLLVFRLLLPRCRGRGGLHDYDSGFAPAVAGAGVVAHTLDYVVFTLLMVSTLVLRGPRPHGPLVDASPATGVAWRSPGPLADVYVGVHLLMLRGHVLPRGGGLLALWA